MGRALVIGAVASSALILGALIGTRVRVPQRVLAVLLAFASGALITALTFELFAESYESSGVWAAGAGFFLGAAVFVAISTWLDRRVEAEHPAAEREAGSSKIDTGAAASDAPATAGAAAGLALLAAVTLDGVPENLALGISLEDAATGGTALLVAIFISNLPEALVGAASMSASGWGVGRIVGTWTVAAVLLTFAVVAGNAFLAGSAGAGSLPLAFAAGAVIASLADTLMPEAYEKGGPPVALATAAGFLVSFLLAA